MTESWENVMGVLESPGKVSEFFLFFFVSKRVGTLCQHSVEHSIYYYRLLSLRNDKT